MKRLRPARWEHMLTALVLRLGASGTGARPQRPGGLLRVFTLVEWILLRGRRYYPLHASGVLLYEIRSSPRTLRLPGERPVRRGEAIVSLHFNNNAVSAMARHASSRQALTWQFARAALADFEALAKKARAGTLPGSPRAVWAESILYRAFARYGFETRAAPRTLRTPFARLYMLALMALYGSMDVSRLSGHYQDRLELGEAWMSMAQLRLTDRNPRRPSQSTHPAHAPDQHTT